MNEIERLLDDLNHMSLKHPEFRIKLKRGELDHLNEAAAYVVYYTPHDVQERLTHKGIIPEKLHELVHENNAGVRDLQQMAGRAVRTIRAAGIELAERQRPLETLVQWAIGDGLACNGRPIGSTYSLGNAFLAIREKLLDELARFTPIGEQMSPSEASSSAEEDTQKKAAHDTKSDTPKNEKKRRPMNRKAADCARRFIADGGIIPMKTIVEDYVDEYGGSAASILRTLADHPEQWKTRQKDDT